MPAHTILSLVGKPRRPAAPAAPADDDWSAYHDSRGPSAQRWADARWAFLLACRCHRFDGTPLHSVGNLGQTTLSHILGYAAPPRAYV